MGMLIQLSLQRRIIMANKEKTFEEKMVRLEDIVKEIDKAEASLDENLKLYIEGVELIKDIEKTLTDAKEKIQKVNTSK